MRHILKTDDKTPTEKRLVNELRRHSNVVEFEAPTQTGTVPEGYMTGDEFFAGIKEELKKRSQENGLLQQNCSE